MRLICFPFAGGSAKIFHGWEDLFPPEVEIASVQMPGRENRYREPPLRSMTEAVEGVVAALESMLDLPFAFFGYSLGGLIAYETTLALARREAPTPRRLFIAAVTAPHSDHAREPLLHQLPYDELIEEIRSFQGTPEEVLRNAEVMKLMMPMIRADFEILETYRSARPTSLPIPISVFGGIDDHEVIPEKLAEWSDCAAAGFSMQFLPGGHFFLKQSQQRLSELLTEELRPVLATVAETVTSHDGSRPNG